VPGTDSIAAGEQSPLTVVIAEQSGLVRAGLRALIANEPRCRVLAEVASPSGFDDAIRSHRPDLLVSEVCYRGVHALSQLEELCRRPEPSARVLVVSGHEEPTLVRETMQTGVHGYLPTSATVEELLSAVRTVADGGRYLHPSLGCSVLDANWTNCITPREGDVINLMARGFTTHEVADRLFISPRSVEGARASVREKVGAKTRSELFTFAHKHGYLLSGCVASLPTVK
jgi:two-component system, NarL family, response regulator NreC